MVQVAVQRLERRLIVHEAAYDAGACARQSCNQTWRPSNMGMGRKGNAGFDLTPGSDGGVQTLHLGARERGDPLKSDLGMCFESGSFHQSKNSVGLPQAVQQKLRSRRVIWANSYDALGQKSGTVSGTNHANSTRE